MDIASRNFTVGGLKLVPFAGTDIHQCIREAVALAVDHQCDIQFVFNGKPISVSFPAVREALAPVMKAVGEQFS